MSGICVKQISLYSEFIEKYINTNACIIHSNILHTNWHHVCIWAHQSWLWYETYTHFTTTLMGSTTSHISSLFSHLIDKLFQKEKSNDGKKKWELDKKIKIYVYRRNKRCHNAHQSWLWYDSKHIFHNHFMSDEVSQVTK